MPHLRLLLLSNSTTPGERYLAWARSHLSIFLGREVRRVFFVPFAGVIRPWDEYAKVVGGAFDDLGYQVVSAHETDDPVAELRRCDAVAVGGGNTFQLLARLHETGLTGAIGEAVRKGMPYVGWSAGSNIACPTIRTTNDMPIVETRGFGALNLIPFQINAHYTEARLDGHGGETRIERLNEFVCANPGMPVVGIPEGTALRVDGKQLTLIGRKKAVVYGLGGKPLRAGAKELAELKLMHR